MLHRLQCVGAEEVPRGNGYVAAPMLAPLCECSVNLGGVGQAGTEGARGSGGAVAGAGNEAGPTSIAGVGRGFGFIALLLVVEREREREGVVGVRGDGGG